MKLEDIYNIPMHKRVWHCLFNYKKWRLAQAYNKVAASLLLSRDHELGEEVNKRANKLWLEIYAKAF